MLNISAHFWTKLLSRPPFNYPEIFFLVDTAPCFLPGLHREIMTTTKQVSGEPSFVRDDNKQACTKKYLNYQKFSFLKALTQITYIPGVKLLFCRFLTVSSYQKLISKCFTLKLPDSIKGSYPVENTMVTLMIL